LENALNEPLESNKPAEVSVETSIETPVETFDEKKAALTKNRRKLVFLFAIAIVPMFVAYGLFFYFPDLIPASTTNEGVLIQPPLSGVTLGLTEPVVEPGGVWTMLIPVAATCGEQCQRRLYLSRQIKIGLGKDADRIERIALLSVDPSAELHALLTAEHGDLTAQIYSSQALQRALQSRLPGATAAEYLLLMDPNGNIMMFYSFEKIGAPLRKDIKHLLKISNIG
jgi:cytochrome oxidase Cu insertion factor (SCO1/SenC/PrrC family)